MEVDTSHRLAKDAGNTLRGYVLSFSSASVGVFFYTLTSRDVGQFPLRERIAVGVALLFFVITVVLCLVELRVDAKRFFEIAKQLEKSPAVRSWERNLAYKKLRYRLIHISYGTVGIGIAATAVYLTMRLV